MVANFLKKSSSVFSSKQTNILSASMVIMVMVLISAFLGLIRVRLLSHFFGDSRILDIYWAAFRLPDMLFQLMVMGAVSSAFIPVFSSYLVKKDLKNAYSVANTIITISVVVFLCLAIIISFFLEKISAILAPGFSPQEIILMSQLTKIMLFSQVFFIAGNFITGMLQSFHRFLLASLAPIFYNLGIILGIIILAPTMGIYGPTFGVLLGTILFLLVQLPLVIKIGWKYQISFFYKHPGVIEMSKLMIPRTISLGISQIEYTADLMIASLFAPGHYTVFSFALFLVGLPIRLFGATIGQASLPTLSLNFAEDNLEKYKKTLLSSLQQIIYLVFPASIILLILRIPLVRLAFGSSSFSWEATILAGQVVGFFTIAIISQSLTQLLIRGFYALHDTKTPFLVGLISVSLNVISSIIFAVILNMGVVGLAISSSISSFINALFLVLLIFKKIGQFNENIITPLIKKITATLFMGLILYLLMRILDFFVFDTTKTLNLILLTVVTLIVGAGSYIFISKLLKIEEASAYLSLFHRLKNWRQILSRNEELITETSQVT